MLYADPWWPRPDIWHTRDTVGPKGELCASEEECLEAFGGSYVSPSDWTRYASTRPWIAESANKQASSTLVQNHRGILKDASWWIEAEGYPALSTLELDLGLRAIAGVLWDFSGETTSSERQAILQLPGVAVLLIYLDRRVCVPRDMGAPVAAAIRTLSNLEQGAATMSLL